MSFNTRHPLMALSLVASTCCAFVMSGSAQAKLKTLETLPKTELKLHEIEGRPPMALSPDGHLLATGSSEAIKLWDPYTEKVVKTLPYAPSLTEIMTFSPDGKWLACTAYKDATGKDKTEVAQLWDVSSGKMIRTLGEHAKKINGLSFSSDGKLLATGSADQTVKIWDVSTSKLLHTIDLKDVVVALQFIPGGHDLLCNSIDLKMRVLNADSGVVVRVIDDFHYPGAAAVSADGSTIVSDTCGDMYKILHGELPPTAAEDALAGKMTFRELATGKILRASPEPIEGGFNSLALSPDGKLVASGNGYDYTLGFWDADTTKELIRIIDGRIKRMAFTPDGRILVIQLDQGDTESKIQLLPLSEVEVLKNRISKKD